MPIFVQYSGMEGNVARLPSTQWIEIDSFQWGVGRGISSPTGGSSDREGSTPSVGEIVVTKKTDARSANLFNECLQGATFEVSVIFKELSGNHTLKLKDATITHFVPHIAKGSGGGKVTWREKLTLRFSEYDFNGLGNVPIPHTLVHF
jgi:type VI secretion system secreted protein Hcp